MASTSIIFDILARDRASKTIDHIGSSASSTTTKMDKFHKVGAAAGVALAGGLALAGKAAFDMTKKAALDAQGAARLAQTLHKATGATKEQQGAVEDWISAQEKALGVSDDELRPALSKLAVATGSVAKAQKLASLAMDVSEGTGKSLTSVSFALAKAQNGNVSGLARLGVATTKTTGDTMALEKAQTSVKSAQLAYTAAVKAHGKSSTEASIASDKLKQAQQAVGVAQSKTTKTTLSLHQITKNLADTYGGAAAKNAQTAAGKQKILSVEYQELQEQIGAGLLPVMSRLATVGLSVTNWISNNTKVAAILAGILGGLVAVTWAVSAATKAWAAITKIAAAGQWLLNAAMDANPIGLVVIALAALAVGLVIAYKKSATFRAIVQGAFEGVQKVAAKVLGWLKTAVSATIGFVKSHWMLLVGIIGGPVALAAVLVIKNWGKIKSAVTNAVSNVIGFIRSHWQAIVSLIGGPLAAAAILVVRHFADIRDGIAHAIGATLAFVRGIPGKIKSALGNLKKLLTSAGVAVIQGLIDGIRSKISEVTGMLSGLAGKMKDAIKNPLGIFSPSKVFRGYGQNLMDGLLQGIADRQMTVQSAMDKIAGTIQNVGARISSLMSTKQGFLSTFTSDSIFAADTSGGVPTIDDLLKQQKQKRHQARRLSHDVSRVTDMGLSGALLKQLQSEGTAGAAVLHQLAQGSKADIERMNRLNKQTSEALRRAGLKVGNQIRGGSISDDIRRARKQEHVLDLLEHHLKDLIAHEKKGQTIIVEIDSEAIIKSIVRRNKRKGVKHSGV